MTDITGDTSDTELSRLLDSEDATAIAERVRAREISPVELHAESTRRIAERDPQINAMVALDDARSSAAAAQLAQDLANGTAADMPFRRCAVCGQGSGCNGGRRSQHQRQPVVGRQHRVG